jgi:hypothetical protein
MAHPPTCAQALIESLAPHARRDSIIGDLLEEYRASQLPEVGQAAADRWFVRQALGFLWTSAAVPAALLAAVLTTRTLLDIAAPAADTANRAWLTTLVTMLVFALDGFRVGLRTRRVSGAVLTALAATAVGTIAAYAATLATMGVAQAFVHPGAAAWAGLREGLDVPAHMIALIGTTLASVGAVIGRAFPKWPFPVSP